VNRSPWGVIVRSPDARDAWPSVSGIRMISLPHQRLFVVIQYALVRYAFFVL
jgi:hypothetical protein